LAGWPSRRIRSSQQRKIDSVLGLTLVFVHLLSEAQIGYFKAKHAFFHFAWSDVEDDCAFVLTRYFIGQAFEPHPITKHERFAQRVLIAERFGYRLWSADFLPQLVQQAAQIVRRDVTPGFIVAELIAYLNEHKIVRPGYTTLQDLISEALSAERFRLGGLLEEVLDDAATAALWLSFWCATTPCPS
jgi:hypothetical protein